MNSTNNQFIEYCLVILAVITVIYVAYIMNKKKSQSEFNLAQVPEPMPTPPVQLTVPMSNFEKRYNNEEKSGHLLANDGHLRHEYEEVMPYHSNKDFEQLIKYNTHKSEYGCPLNESALQLNFNNHENEKKQTMKGLTEHMDLRSKLDQSSEEFSKDPVDVINMLYLSGNHMVARGYEDETVQEVYDNITRVNPAYVYQIPFPDFRKKDCKNFCHNS